MSVAESKNETLPKDKMSVAEGTKCPLPKGQNDLIKDKNIKDNIIKDNNGIPSANAEEIQESVPEAEEITMEAFKARYEEHLSLANTHMLATKGIVIIFGKTYKIINQEV